MLWSVTKDENDSFSDILSVLSGDFCRFSSNSVFFFRQNRVVDRKRWSRKKMFLEGIVWLLAKVGMPVL